MKICKGDTKQKKILEENKRQDLLSTKPVGRFYSSKYFKRVFLTLSLKYTYNLLPPMFGEMKEKLKRNPHDHCLEIPKITLIYID